MIFRESHTCLAIRPRFRTAGRLSFERQPGQQTRHGLTTGRIGIDDLAEKHPQRHQLRIDRLRRFGLRPGHVAEHVGGQQIEKWQPRLLPERIPNRIDLPRNAFPSTMVHIGLLAGFQGSFVALHNPCRQGWPFFAIAFAPNHLRPRKCHWGDALGWATCASEQQLHRQETRPAPAASSSFRPKPTMIEWLPWPTFRKPAALSSESRSNTTRRCCRPGRGNLRPVHGPFRRRRLRPDVYAGSRRKRPKPLRPLSAPFTRLWCAQRPVNGPDMISHAGRYPA